ncbi:hypothetical protein GQR60_09690 [Labilibaculum sp. A4]|uniref:Uncharacterized protein n=1 Tax=Labilibaculum euxinus TaxID=2686357 RepID=A0A7M4D8Z5_9BACT|nr:hypothetical protein [Labilibaculum euxinus]MDQ1771500.1 hypothetical protein [Labilibaculum euxinus]MUP39124.1 hypothetical protein [Labilibaculum euxinus]MVB08329.1 hypothetical protein [Labilibaculum euxinus]MWN76612.1 hypothetical protein [Labilibaculum euxinus]
MTRQVFTYLFTILLGFGFISCEKINSNDLADDTPVYQSYKLVYDNYMNETTATAEFKVRNSSGVHIKLVEDSNVKFNGERHHDYWPLFHEYIWKTRGFSDVDFIYNKNWDRDFVNSIYTDDIAYTTIPNDLEEIDLFSSGRLYWNGSPLSYDESITISIEQSGTTISKTAGRRNSEYIYLDSDDMRNLYPGPATIHLEREKRYRLDEEDGYAGGKKIIIMKDKKQIYLYE